MNAKAAKSSRDSREQRDAGGSELQVVSEYSKYGCKDAACKNKNRVAIKNKSHGAWKTHKLNKKQESSK